MDGASSSSLSDSQLKSRLQEMDDYDFEHLVADLWKRQGWRTTVKQQSVDRGVDVVAERDDPFPQKWLIQVKCYSGTLGGPDVRQYVSLQHRPGVGGAIVVSSGPFSKQARQEERDHNLKLIDGDALVSLIRNTDSYDLVDRYITVENSAGSQVSEQGSFDSKSSNAVSRSSSEQEQQSSGSGGSDEWTRIDDNVEGIRQNRDMDEAIESLDKILFEQPPRNLWWKAIVSATGFWALFLLVPSSLLDGAFGGILGVALLISWPLLPIALYMDSKVAPEYTANWYPKRWYYIVSSMVPVIGLFSGAVYLWRRRQYGANKNVNNLEELRDWFRDLVEDLEYTYD